ncbi:DUF726-domain-containing protein [Xylariaceae sp. FL0016]|nr:DUF726-domain-containing protein [Xylariaceae sp. FL0016]
MAPLTNEPDALRVVLNMARRKAFYSLVSEITAYMRTQLESKHSPPASSPSPSPHGCGAPPPPYSETQATSRSPITPSAVCGAEAEGAAPAPRPQQQPHGAASPALTRLRRAALLHFDSWRAETLGKLREVAARADDQKALDARRRRGEAMRARRTAVPDEGEDLLSFGAGEEGAAKSQMQAPPLPTSAVASFQALYHPIPTRLATIPLEDRQEVLSATLILLLSVGSYSAHSRTLMCHLCSALEVPPAFLHGEETEIATTMVQTARRAEAEDRERRSNGGMSAEAEAQKRRDEGAVGRFWKVGLASVAGAAIIGVTGGLAAPAVAGVVGGLMGTVGLGGLASFLGIFWMNGALVGTLFGAFGAKMTGDIVDQYAKEVEDFKFLPLREPYGEAWSQEGEAKTRRLRVTIGINGWLEQEDDVARPWRVLGDESEVFALRFEMSSLMALGRRLKALVSSAAWSAVRGEILSRTVLATLQGALWPVLLLNSASSLDNPFSLARNRSEKAGRVLADALVNRVQGERPVTLVGYSLGARVVYSCLRELAERKAFGLIDTVVLIGAPVPSNPSHWAVMRTVVSGKLYNVYSENDYILAFLYRSTSLQLGIAGLQAISEAVDGVENLNLSEEVLGHLRYPKLIAQILGRCGFPGVKGGDGAIEKEDNEIRLQDKDYAELGTLIDVEEPAGNKQLEPSRHSRREMENEKFDPTVKNVTEQKADSIVRDARLLGGMKAQSSGATSSTIPVPVTSSMPNLHEQRGRDAAGLRVENRSASAGRIAHEASSSSNLDDDDGDEEDYGGGITMMDNDELSDGDLTIVEPLRIED